MEVWIRQTAVVKTQMTNTEVNVYIWEKILGKCWHEPKSAAGKWGWGLVARCIKCDEAYDCDADAHFKMNYCSNTSPRSLLRGVIEVVASPDSYAHFEDILLEVICRDHSKSEWRTYNNSYFTYLMVNASAEQIARACVEAHRLDRGIR